MEASTVKPKASEYSLVQQSEQTPIQVFCDGVTGMTMSAANFKLDLHQVIGGDEKGERRKIVQTLVMPTVSLVELCRLVLRAVEGNPTMALALDEQRAAILNQQKSSRSPVAPVESAKAKV